MSLSLRLFGNVYGEELVVLIMASIVPFLVPLPMMFLGVITGSLQAYIFTLLTIIYLAGAVHIEHGHDDAHHDDAARARRLAGARPRGGVGDRMCRRHARRGGGARRSSERERGAKAGSADLGNRRAPVCDSTPGAPQATPATFGS